jgi:hypothetical protein
MYRACMADPGRWPVAGSLADLLHRMQEHGASGNSEAGGPWPLWPSQGCSECMNFTRIM